MKKLMIWLLLLSFAAIGACSNQTTVVLLPDPDGKVGKVEVSNKQGSQTMGQAYQAVGVEMEGRAPLPPEPISLGEVKRIFGGALEATPEAPVRFMLYFKLGSPELVPESKKVLHEVIWTIKDRASMDISVVGHCDTYGAEDANIRLSTRRAQAVADSIVAAGIAKEYLEITSYGERYPIVPTGDQVKEPKNRRVEVTIR